MSMRPNSALGDAVARRKRLERYRSAPTARDLGLRPFGYLLAGVVWTALFVATLGIPLLIPAGLQASGPWRASEQLADFDPVIGVIAAVFFVAVIAPIFGYVMLALPLATGPLAVLSFTYLVRSLRPSFRGEHLSATGWSRGGIGLITVLPTALSLLPIRMTRWTGFWTGLYMMGWIPSLRLLIAAFPAGIGYLVTVVWVLWPLENATAILVWSIVTALFAAATVVLMIRDARHRFFTRRDQERPAR